MTNNGFIKLQRGMVTEELLKDSTAFRLLTLIAIRTWRGQGLNRHGLSVGEAFLGKRLVEGYGLTEQTYRSAKERLENYGLATFTGTNKGTKARLTDTSIYDVNVQTNNEQKDKPPTGQQRASNEPATPNKKDKKIRSKEDKKEEARARRVDKPESLEAVKEFVREKGLRMDAAAFWNHFESNGWRVGGRSPMKNWHAAALNWAAREKQFAGRNTGRAAEEEEYRPSFLKAVKE